MIRKNNYATKAPKSKHRGQARFLGICGAILVTLTVSASAKSAEPLDFRPSDVNILDADSGTLIGHGHYEVDRVGNQFVLHGENRYLSGEYDIEEDRLDATGDHSRPTLRRYRHDFYDAAGTLVVASHLDVETGLGVCGRVENGAMSMTSEPLNFGADTYAGASILLPIQEFLRRGDINGTLDLHVFNCFPSPKLIAVRMKRVAKKQTWSQYPGELEEIDIKPNFGFFTIIVAPFVPKLAAWFDPTRDFLLVGAQLQRYYKGVKIILVRAHPANATTEANKRLASPPP